jgi:hypothetical protein
MPVRPHIVVVIPRGEAVRNFLYSDTLRVLGANARVTLLSVIHDDAFAERFDPYVDRIIPLEISQEHRLVQALQTLVHDVHFRWLWSGVARWRFAFYDNLAKTARQKIVRSLYKGIVRSLANRPTIEVLSGAQNRLAYHLRTTKVFDKLFAELKPDLVFNTSHVHGPASDLPMRVAYQHGIATASFIFSWDNLTSRSRILVPYDYYLVWHQAMHDKLLEIYRRIKLEQVFITGTPQFDFHFKPANWLTREELAAKLGIDPGRPFVLYTTGIDTHFPEEHLMVQLVIRLLREMKDVQPQLVVRNYVKGTSEAMRKLTDQSIPDVAFPPMLWDDRWFMPTTEDQVMLTGMLRECAVGINAASTVSLELLMHDKPVINLGFDPPGSKLPEFRRYYWHVDVFDHYIPVAQSGAVMVARSEQDMATYLRRGLSEAQTDSAVRRRFIKEMFGNTLDGESGRRVAEKLLELACRRSRSLQAE